MPRYRMAFFERLREDIAGVGIKLEIAYGRKDDEGASLGLDGRLVGGIEINNKRISIGRRHFLWQPCLRLASQADLVIVEQASRLLVNNVLLLMQSVGLARVAFWGHGANLQQHSASKTGELLKRVVSRYPHWWFAYTESTKERVAGLGYPSERITVVQNAQDTEELARIVDQLGDADARAFRDAFDLGSGPIGLFLGSLYREKRLPFLIDAGEHLARLRPDFRLVVAGDGPDRHVVEDAAERFEWLRYVGRLEGVHERAQALTAASAVLMPGLVGLVVLDAFAAGKPLVTTAIDYHSPEIEYLRDGENGLMVAGADDPEVYANAIASLLRDDTRYQYLVAGCMRARTVYTLEAMVQRFIRGVADALAA